MRRRVEYKGNWTIQFLFFEDGRCKAQKFIDKLQIREQAAIHALLKQVAKYGPPWTDNAKFKKVEGDLWELKPTSQVRLLCILEGSTLLVRSALKKQRSGLMRRDIESAKKLLGRLRNLEGKK